MGLNAHRPFLRYLMAYVEPNIRFREARERLGLSPDEAASRSGLSDSEIWDIEAIADELTSCYSPKEVQQFCQALQLRPIELFADNFAEKAFSADELVRLIHAECHSRGMTFEQFEDVVGWQLSACIEPPAKLLEDMTVDGLQWLCRELHIDWRRVILSL